MNLLRMRRFLLLLTFLSAFFAPPEVRAGTEMDRTFERLERDYKKLREGLKAPSDSDRDLYVKKAGEMLAEARKAREMEPEMTARVAETERARFLEKFQRDMDVFIDNLGKLEEALKNSQWDEARLRMETLWQNKKDGHKAYIERKKK